MAMLDLDAGTPAVHVGVPDVNPTPNRGVLAMLRFALPRVLTVVILIVAAAELKWGIDSRGWGSVVGRDLAIYTEASQRLLSGGSWYLERQLEGAYAIQPGDVLFPPVTLWFFAPWLVLPGPLFVAIPIVLTAWLVRPSPWGWVLIALCIAWPFTLLRTLSGNPNTWLMLVIALALSFRWPGALILLKPSYLPLALIGIRTRGWWLTVGAVILLSLPFLAESLAYPRVILSSNGGLLYSLNDIHILLIPFIGAVFGRLRYGHDYRPAINTQLSQLRHRISKSEPSASEV